jgi:hypothetical protein
MVPIPVAIPIPVAVPIAAAVPIPVAVPAISIAIQIIADRQPIGGNSVPIGAIASPIPVRAEIIEPSRCDGVVGTKCSRHAPAGGGKMRR